MTKSTGASKREIMQREAHRLELELEQVRLLERARLLGENPVGVQKVAKELSRQQKSLSRLKRSGTQGEDSLDKAMAPSALQDYIASLDKKLWDNAQEMNAYTSQVTQHLERMKSLKAQSDGKDRKIVALERKIRNCEVEMKKKDQELSQAKSDFERRLRGKDKQIQKNDLEHNAALAECEKELTLQIDSRDRVIESLKSDLERLERETTARQATMTEEYDSMKSSYERQIEQLKDEHLVELTELRTSTENKYERLLSMKQDEVTHVRDSSDRDKKQLKQRLQSSEQHYSTLLENTRNEAAEKRQEFHEHIEEMKRSQEERIKAIEEAAATQEQLLRQSFGQAEQRYVDQIQSMSTKYKDLYRAATGKLESLRTKKQEFAKENAVLRQRIPSLVDQLKRCQLVARRLAQCRETDRDAVTNVSAENKSLSELVQVQRQEISAFRKLFHDVSLYFVPAAEDALEQSGSPNKAQATKAMNMLSAMMRAAQSPMTRSELQSLNASLLSTGSADASPSGNISGLQARENKVNELLTELKTIRSYAEGDEAPTPLMNSTSMDLNESPAPHLSQPNGFDDDGDGMKDALEQLQHDLIVESLERHK